VNTRKTLTQGRATGTWVGLDIGSTAVRAAEITSDGQRRVLRRFAQVPLPKGAVVDGEVVKTDAVGAALRQLWEEGKFSTQKVVVGVSSQRVIVRPAEVAAMPAEDFKLALKFEAQELVPMPVEEAVLDFRVLVPEVDSDAASGNQRMRILLAAAHREMIAGHLAALDLAGLEAVAVDVMPLALLRAVPEERDNPLGTDAVVSLGGDLTTVTIRENGNPRFARTVGMGGSKITNSIASELSYSAADAEELKCGADGPVQVLDKVHHLVTMEIGTIVNEVNGSLDYFLAQAECDRVDRVIVTGGACLTDGLLDALVAHVDAPVEVADPLIGLSFEDAGLSGEAAAHALAAVGLALWGYDEPDRQLTLLPQEVLAARRDRRRTRAMAVALVCLAAVLGGAWAVRHEQVASVRNQVASYVTSNRSLQSQVTALSGVTNLKSQVGAQRQLAAGALNGNVDWVRLLGQLAAVMPPDQYLSSFAGTSNAAGGQSTGTAQGAPSLGTVQVTVSGHNGQESVAQWLRATARVPSLSNVSVGGSSDGGSLDSFSSSASLGPLAASNRAASLPGAQP
jgi:type IV pilus assembly protein PilM